MTYFSQSVNESIKTHLYNATSQTNLSCMMY